MNHNSLITGCAQSIMNLQCVSVSNINHRRHPKLLKPRLRWIKFKLPLLKGKNNNSRNNNSRLLGQFHKKVGTKFMTSTRRTQSEP